MSIPINSSVPPPQVQTVSPMTAGGPDASTAGAIVQANGLPLTNTSKISSLQDLKNKSPKVYNAMMQSTAMAVCNQMQHSQDRLKKVMRKAREDAQGG